jgi:hypothetical protein
MRRAIELAGAHIAMVPATDDPRNLYSVRSPGEIWLHIPKDRLANREAASAD